MEYEADTKFCQLCIRRKAVSLDALNAAASEQSGERARGLSPRTVDAILVALGHLTEEDAEALRQAQRALEATQRDFRERRLGDYQIISRIGRGGMATVFKARDRRDGKLVALKVLLPQASRSGQSVERFLREARVACALRHENIVRGLGTGHDRGVGFFAMEYVGGRNVAELIDRTGPLPEEAVASVGIQLARALEHAQASGVVHRDVKPSNLLVDRRGVLKLCDLGLARSFSLESGVTTSGVTLGTPKYISPEQARGDPDVDGRADIYGAGVTLFHLACGEPPFAGASGIVVISKHIYEDVPRARSRRPEISLDLDAVIFRATRKDPKDRYQSPRAMLDELEAIARRRGYRLREPLARLVAGRGAASARGLARSDAAPSGAETC